MKLVWLLIMSCVSCFSQELRMSDVLESLPALSYPYALRKVTRPEIHVRMKISIQDGIITNIETESALQPEQKLAIAASKALIQKFKFKNSTNGIISLQLNFRLMPPVPGAIPTAISTIDWQRNQITFDFADTCRTIACFN